MFKLWVIISMEPDDSSFFDIIILCHTKRIESSHNIWYNVAAIVITNIIYLTSHP